MCNNIRYCTDIIAITHILSRYRYFVPFAIVCNLKTNFVKVKESVSAQARENVSRDVVDVRRHLKVRHATATSKRVDIQ